MNVSNSKWHYIPRMLLTLTATSCVLGLRRSKYDQNTNCATKCKQNLWSHNIILQGGRCGLHQCKSNQNFCSRKCAIITVWVQSQGVNHHLHHVCYSQVATTPHCCHRYFTAGTYQNIRVSSGESIFSQQIHVFSYSRFLWMCESCQNTKRHCQTFVQCHISASN